jgi:hypothetical protein
MFVLPYPRGRQEMELAITAELASELPNLGTNVALRIVGWVLSQIKGLAESGERLLP